MSIGSMVWPFALGRLKLWLLFDEIVGIKGRTPVDCRISHEGSMDESIARFYPPWISGKLRRERDADCVCRFAAVQKCQDF